MEVHLLFQAVLFNQPFVVAKIPIDPANASTETSKRQ